jgi:hypothetical protein
MILTDFQDALDFVPVADYPVRNDFDRPSLLRRSLMRSTLLCLSVLFLVPHVDAAPAPEPGLKAKEKLETLKKKLPALVGDWLKENENIRWFSYQRTYSPKLRVMRRVGPDRAKAVILFEAFDKNGARARYYDALLTVFLTYQDGCWTTERFEEVIHISNEKRPTFAYLMLAIDEAAEKQGTK